MTRILVSVLIVALVSLLGYRQFGDHPLDVRDAIDAAVQDAKRNTSMDKPTEDLLRLQLAIVDYIGKNGRPPSILGELVPSYLDTIPIDPNTKQAYKYERAGGSYTLGEDSGTTQLASLKQDEKSNDGKETTEPTSIVSPLAVAMEDGYVNPNTMQEEVFVYDSNGKRDPFLSFDLAPKKLVDETISPLERYSLGQLRVAAVVSDPNTQELMAIVEDAAGKGYTVRAGTKIGDSGGVVVTVEKTLLKVLETKIDFTGVETQNVIEMKIHAQENTDVSKQKGKKKKKSD